MVALIGHAAAAVWVYMTLLYVLAQAKKNNAFADVGWGLGFIVVLGVLWVLRPEGNGPKVLVAAMVVLWGARLTGHIFLRNRGKEEDFRYARMRRQWGRRYLLKAYVFVFMLQGIFMTAISLSPIAVFSSGRRPLSVWDALGAAVFAAGFCFEAVGDWQLRRFLRRPENSGRLMTEGLWAWTRHPNYFGEAALWWGIGFVAVQAEHGWAALASALTITVLVRFVSGVPLLEKKYAGREDFEAYKKRTSVFFPLPPRPPVAEKSKTDR